MTKIIRNMLAVVFALTAGTVIIYAYGSYNECRCNQASPGISLSICCANGWGGYGGSGDTRCCSSGYSWDSVGKTCCGWTTNTIIQPVTQQCVQQNTGTCYIENSVTYGLPNRPACTVAKKGTIWTVPGANSGVCVPKGTNSGGVICPGAVTGWNQPYQCNCS